MKKILLTSLLVLSLLCSAGCGEQTEEPEMSLLAINVRKADALLLRCGQSAYLIDTGIKKNSAILLDVLRKEGITKLTGVILTHTHADHTGGLKALLESEIVVENIYTSKYYVLKKEDGKHPVEKATKKTDHEPLELNEDAENNNSLVILAEGGGGSILLTGDMEFPEEDSLLKAGLIPHADVLKVGNHGEGDATSNAFVNAVQPSLAVISTNTEDEPDTPDPRVLKLLNDSNIPVLITQDAEEGVLVTLRNGEITTEMK